MRLREHTLEFGVRVALQRHRERRAELNAGRAEGLQAGDVFETADAARRDQRHLALDTRRAQEPDDLRNDVLEVESRVVQVGHFRRPEVPAGQARVFDHERIGQPLLALPFAHHELHAARVGQDRHQQGRRVVLGLAAALQLHRLLTWQPLITRSRPILWVLHAAYAWIPIGLALLALSELGLLGVSAGVHALAVGATGGLVIGMITRTARGHTGRPLRVSKAEVAAYGLVLAAALLRTGVPLLAPHGLSYAAPLVAAAVAWSSAFAIYLWVFTPWLMRTRLDGKDG